jgi:hemerythrin-like domain-containing protein
MADFQNPPIKRHPSLQPLSRDHYQGLVQAQHLSKSAEQDDAARRRALAEFLDHWQMEIAQHFADEERLLPPYMHAEDKQRLEAEHATLRKYAKDAEEHRRQIDPGIEWIAQLGKMLHDHIRWEERELFPRVEANAGQEALQALHPEAERIEASRNRDRCETNNDQG